MSRILRVHLHGITWLVRHRRREHASVRGLELHSRREHLAGEGGLGQHGRRGYLKEVWGRMRDTVDE